MSDNNTDNRKQEKKEISPVLLPKFDKKDRKVFIRDLGHDVSVAQIGANPIFYIKTYKLGFMFKLSKADEKAIEEMELVREKRK